MGFKNRKRSNCICLCLRCGNVKKHEARGLCKCCYNHLREGRCREGESLDSYPLMPQRYDWPGVGGGDGLAAEKFRVTHDPLHIPMKEARAEYAD